MNSRKTHLKVSPTNTHTNTRSNTHTDSHARVTEKACTPTGRQKNENKPFLSPHTLTHTHRPTYGGQRGHAADYREEVS